MSNYNNYPPKGIDTKLLIVQNVLAEKLGFTNVDFYGRALKILAKDGKSFMPEFYAQWPKRKEVYYDGKNAPGGNVFFIVEDVESIKKGWTEANVKVVFMLNLEKIYSNLTYWPDAEIQEKCYSLIKKQGTIDINGIEKGIEKVFQGFNTSGIKLNGMQPYHCFSINGIIKYQFNCNH
jgi:hypothetical protein